MEVDENAYSLRGQKRRLPGRLVRRWVSLHQTGGGEKVAETSEFFYVNHANPAVWSSLPRCSHAEMRQARRSRSNESTNTVL